MITVDIDRLYKLLPYIYQLRDHEQGEPLRELLKVISEQVNNVEENIDQLYDNWFIETCEDWVVPYLGDLVGYTPVHEAGEPGEITTLQGRLRNKILIPRREVANTIRYRRRKGTLALLEQLANDVAGWPARAVEFYKLLGWTQHVNHLRPFQGRTVNLRDGKVLNKLDTPFDELAHTADVRRINSSLSPGRHNIPSIGLFVWRLKIYSVTQTPVNSLDQRHCYTFSVLGNEAPLYTKWERETEPTRIAGELDLPVPISREALSETVKIEDSRASVYYGEHKSLVIYAQDWPSKEQGNPISFENIIPADLSDWDRYKPVKDTVAVDPKLGRILFPPKQVPKKGVKVSYHYAFSADMGGGEYPRKLSQPAGSKLYQVNANIKDKESEDIFSTLQKALNKWQSDSSPPQHAVIEITDSGLYEEALNIELKAGQTLQIRAANKKRPVIRIPDRPDQFKVSGEENSYLTLDGLLIAGRGLQVEKTETGESIKGIIIRHSTLVPGWSLEPDCEPSQLDELSIEITNAYPCLTVEHSIIGSIQVNNDEVKKEPIQIRISDSILDATGNDCEGPACEAVGVSGSGFAHAVLTIVRSTVFGRIDTHAIALAENSIFMGTVQVAHRQLGCMRFCYTRPCSRTPKRYRCQPDLAEQAAESDLIQTAKENGQLLPSQEAIKAAKRYAHERVRPQFNCHRYGTPTYCQLSDYCAEEIKRGAGDEAEMGVFHDLFQPQREANLRARLDEYIPARADIGIILAS
jgi:hypothetical protein